jgi:hypothetical protein
MTSADAADHDDDADGDRDDEHVTNDIANM